MLIGKADWIDTGNIIMEEKKK